MYACFLDNDFYKFTMSFFIWNYYKDINVSFKFKNRSLKSLLVSNDQINEEFNRINSVLPTEKELRYLFENLVIHASNINVDRSNKSEESNRIRELLQLYIKDLENINSLQSSIEFMNDTFYVEGPWWLTTLIETPLLASISETHTNSILENVSSFVRDKIEEGNFRNLEEFVRRMNQNRSLRFNDFGTRRRYSFNWQAKSLEYCMKNLEDHYKLAGTSNVHLARKYNLKPIGTFAHELPMVIAAIEITEKYSPVETYSILMKQWKELFHNAFDILLTDTFTTHWLFEKHGNEVVNNWKGVRHDSGDPFQFGEKYIDLCKKNSIDPMDRVIVFSSDLTAEKAEKILEYFRGRVWCAFGIGTKFTNNTEIVRPDIVLKANSIIDDVHRVPYAYTAKLSDEEGKNTGETNRIINYFKKTFKGVQYVDTID